MSACGYIGQCEFGLFEVTVRETCGPEQSGKTYRIQVKVPTQNDGIAYVTDVSARRTDWLYVGYDPIDHDRATDIAEDFVQRHYGSEI